MAMIKTDAEIQIMKEGGAILAAGMKALLLQVVPGITTDELDQLFVKTIREAGAESSFFGYRGYPKSICTSVNDEVVHAIPGKRVLNEGEIISLDCGVRYKGYCTDMARTIGVGSIDPEAQRLIDVTRAALERAVEVMRPGNRIGDIGHAVQTVVEAHGYNVVRVLVGHGVGIDVHEQPAVPNYGTRGTGMRLAPGMMLAVEPMVNRGTSEVVFDEHDGWTVRTADGALTAHFEDTILITDARPIVLTAL